VLGKMVHFKLFLLFLLCNDSYQITRVKKDLNWEGLFSNKRLVLNKYTLVVLMCCLLRALRLPCPLQFLTWGLFAQFGGQRVNPPAQNQNFTPETFAHLVCPLNP
jgi:hypothetical protein